MSDTLPVIGSTPGSQAANTSVAATSDATGNIKFQGPSGIQGSTITCVVTVPLAPATAVFTATLGTIGGQGVVLDTFGGDSTAGQFQILVGQTLVVTGTGMTPNTQYTCTFGQVTDVGDVQTVIPAPNSSALTAQIFSLGIGSIIETLVPVSGVPFGVTLPFGVRTIIVDISVLAGSTITNVEIVGSTSGVIYYNQAPYLAYGAGPTNYIVVVPIIAAIDTSVNVTITAGGLGSITAARIFGDTAEYEESTFYNGVAKAATGTTGALLAGPARLLTASLVSNGTGSGALVLNGNIFLEIATPNLVTAVTFPPNTILPAGQQVAINSFVATVEGSVTYAYP